MRVFDKLEIVTDFLLQIPSDVGAKNTFPLSSSWISGAVQMPMRGIFILEMPGMSLRMMLRFDL